jgi:hypothetical protein
MKTKSNWGSPPKRLYRVIKYIIKQGKRSICVIGCSDGKFVLPFLRKGFHVTAIDIDKIALFGGEKEIPIKKEFIEKYNYNPKSQKQLLIKIPSKKVIIDGLHERAQRENLTDYLKILEMDFYRNAMLEEFDCVFTSCSIQYKINDDLSLDHIMKKLKNHVKKDGYICMDYMMPLADSDSHKSELYFRTGVIRKYFNRDWQIISNREMKKPVFEKAHIDRPFDHFHRFGYILARRIV